MIQGHGALIGFRWFDAAALSFVLLGGLALLALRTAVVTATSGRLSELRRQPGTAQQAASAASRNPATTASIWPAPPPAAPADCRRTGGCRYDPDAEAEALLAALLMAFPIGEDEVAPM